MSDKQSNNHFETVTFHTVDDEYEGQRLDNFLIRLLKGVPKSRIYRLLRKGEVRVNKGRVKADTRLKTGDIVRIAPIRTAQQQSTEMPSNQIRKRLNDSILFEDDAVILLTSQAVWLFMAAAGFPLELLRG